MQFFQVGGCVRDALLGLPVRDRDWVVVGGTPEAMLAHGFRPVGKDFPVFLHPQTHEEYALARTERKTAPGYAGFVFHAAPDVTLEQDLARRDLTINAMAIDASGRLIDPFGGARDLEARLLRHVGPHFVEDPVRILRLARFAARFQDFRVAGDTAALLRQMVDGGEADALVAERVWREIATGLMEARPSRMLAVLDACGLLARRFAELGEAAPLGTLLDRAAGRGVALAPRFALLMSGCASATAEAAVVERLRVDGDSAQLARLLLTLAPRLRPDADAEAIVAVLQQADALRRPPRFDQLLEAAEILGNASLPRFRLALAACQAIDAGAIAARTPGQHEAIREALQTARLEAVREAVR